MIWWAYVHGICPGGLSWWAVRQWMVYPIAHAILTVYACTPQYRACQRAVDVWQAGVQHWSALGQTDADWE